MNDINGGTRPRRRRLLVAASLLLLGTIAACGEIDPTSVDNPRTTAEDLADAEEPVKALLPGLRAQFARAVGAAVTTTAVVSDNYSIHGTGILKELDDPRAITPSEVNATGEGSAHSIYWHLQELRALGDFIIDDIAPQDETSTAAQVAEARYYRGMAFLMQAENFSHVPVEEDGEPIPASELLTRAVSDLEAATAASGEIGVAAQAALARAHRWRGDAAAAGTAAQAALSADPEFVFLVEYDAGSVTNNPWAFLVIRALQEMQPLPRLDFLDPKYLTRESGIPVAKAEEMHLILAEIDLAAGSMGAGRAHLVDAIELARSRGTTTFDDNDARASLDLSIRPRDSVIRIRADADSPFREGLVLDRPGLIEVATISDTSLDPDSVAAIPTGDENALWHALHLARQEILFLEARRMADLGIRLPIMLREIDSNPNIDEDDPGTVVVVPAWIPSGEQMDLFTPFTLYEGGLLDDTQVLIGEEVTINVDMNEVLVANNRTQF